MPSSDPLTSCTVDGVTSRESRKSETAFPESGKRRGSSPFRSASQTAFARPLPPICSESSATDRERNGGIVDLADATSEIIDRDGGRSSGLLQGGDTANPVAAASVAKARTARMSSTNETMMKIA